MARYRLVGEANQIPVCGSEVEVERWERRGDFWVATLANHTLEIGVRENDFDDGPSINQIPDFAYIRDTASGSVLSTARASQIFP